MTTAAKKHKQYGMESNMERWRAGRGMKFIWRATVKFGAQSTSRNT